MTVVVGAVKKTDSEPKKKEVKAEVKEEAKKETKKK